MNKNRPRVKNGYASERYTDDSILAKILPVCERCGRKIWDDTLYEMPNGDLYHPDCMEEEFSRPTKDFYIGVEE